MEDAFLRKYYSVGKTSAVRRTIREFSQGPGEVFYEAWERLRDLLRRLTTDCSSFIRSQTLTFGVNYFLLTNQNLIILVLLDSSGS